MSRKIIQLCTGEYDNCNLYALCDDGKIFVSQFREGGKWSELKNVPQD